jgi:hypothetical protein
MRRFSIRTLMAFILVAAVGLAALRNANELWAGMMVIVALGAVGVAVLGAVFLRGKERAWWIGFAFFGGGYLALAVGPWLSDTFQPQLGTTHLLRYVHSEVTASPPAQGSIAALQQQRADLRLLVKSLMDSGGDPLAIAALSRQLARANAAVKQGQTSTISGSLSFDPASDTTGPPVNRWRSFLPGAANHDSFQRVGHSLFALLAGLVGGMVATWFYAKRERVEAEAG